MSFYVCKKCKGSGHLNDNKIGVLYEFEICFLCYRKLPEDEKPKIFPLMREIKEDNHSESSLQHIVGENSQ